MARIGTSMTTHRRSDLRPARELTDEQILRRAAADLARHRAKVGADDPVVEPLEVRRARRSRPVLDARVGTIYDPALQRTDSSPQNG
jgi:hypothetical protein